jgi:hypothetical protein
MTLSVQGVRFHVIPDSNRYAAQSQTRGPSCGATTTFSVNGFFDIAYSTGNP